MMSFGSNKLGVKTPTGLKTDETTDRIPHFVLGQSFVTGLKVNLS